MINDEYNLVFKDVENHISKTINRSEEKIQKQRVLLEEQENILKMLEEAKRLLIEADDTLDIDNYKAAMAVVKKLPEKYHEQLKLVASDIHERIINKDNYLQKRVNYLIDVIKVTSDEILYEQAVQLVNKMKNTETKDSFEKELDIINKSIIEPKMRILNLLYEAEELGELEAHDEARKLIEEVENKQTRIELRSMASDVYKSIISSYDDATIKTGKKVDYKSIDNLLSKLEIEIATDTDEDVLNNHIEELSNLINKISNNQKKNKYASRLQTLVKILTEEETSKKNDKELTFHILPKEEIKSSYTMSQPKFTNNDENIDELLNSLEAITNEKKKITDADINLLVSMVKNKWSSNLYDSIDRINKIILYYNACNELEIQEEELNNTNTKVDAYAKLDAKNIAMKRKNLLNNKDKFVKKYNSAIESNNERLAAKMMGKITEAEDITDSNVIILIYEIKALMAKIKKIDEKLEENKKIGDEAIELNLLNKKDEMLVDLKNLQKDFEEYAYYDLVDKIEDNGIYKSSDRIKGVVTTLALCLSFVPESKTLNSLKDAIIYKINTENSIDRHLVESCVYEFTKVIEFNKFFNKPYVSYDPCKFEDLSLNDNYLNYGLYKVK